MLALRTCRICGKEALTENDLDDFVTNKYHTYRKLHLCKECQIKQRTKYSNTERGKQNIRKSRRRYNDKLKLRAFQKLSEIPHCTRCGEDDLRVLTMDHIHNDGNIERETLSSYQIMLKMVKMSDEDAQQRYQILCRNCNWIKMLDIYRQERG